MNIFKYLRITSTQVNKGYFENLEWNGMEYRIVHGEQKLWNGIQKLWNGIQKLWNGICGKKIWKDESCLVYLDKIYKFQLENHILFLFNRK